MKKFLCFTLLLINIIVFYNLASPKKVNASTSEYMRVLTSNAYIYQDDTFQTKLFIIPYGYFVYLLEDYGDYRKVSYGSNTDNCPIIIGYMKNVDLTQYLLVPTKPYSIFTVTTNYSDILFNDYDRTTPYFNIPKNSNMIYIGEYINQKNESLAYVYYNSKLGYVDKKAIKSFTVPVSPDKIEPDVDVNENDEENQSNPSFIKNESLQIIIIVGISIISISVVYFLFKPTKNKVERSSDKNYEYYDGVE